MLCIPQPDWYFVFLIHNDIRFPRKTDKGHSHTVFSLTNLSLLEETEALHSFPLMSLNKYCADIQKAPRRAKGQGRKPESEEARLEDHDSNESDECDLQHRKTRTTSQRAKKRRRALRAVGRTTKSFLLRHTKRSHPTVVTSTRRRM